jgi:hypothetical protein
MGLWGLLEKGDSAIAKAKKINFTMKRRKKNLWDADECR